MSSSALKGEVGEGSETHLSPKLLCLTLLGLRTASPSAARSLPTGVPGSRAMPLALAPRARRDSWVECRDEDGEAAAAWGVWTKAEVVRERMLDGV